MADEKNYDAILALQARWDKIRVANVFDALDQMGYPNQVIDLGIRPLRPDQHLAGLAVTVRGRRDPRGREELAKVDPNGQATGSYARLNRACHPGAVIVIDGAGEATTGKLGEMTSWWMKQRGARGVVIDGAIRDYLGVVDIPGWTVCCRNTSPIESLGRYHFMDINDVIAVPGTLTNQVRINPGDWIVGGDDGVIVVPQEISMKALEVSEDIEQREEGMRRDLEAGLRFGEAFAKWNRM